MAEYREQIIEGKRWTRIPRVVIENPKIGVPSLYAVEEEAVHLGGEQYVFTATGTGLQATFDPLATFQLRHPETDELLGDSATQMDLQVLVYSFCRHLQEIRDAQNVAPIEPPQE